MRYEYAAICLSNADGDTLLASVDLGFSISLRMPLRLRGIDCPELRSGNYRTEAKAAKLWLENTLRDKKLIIRTHKDTDKYGRILADVWIEGELISINQQMLDARLAVPYDGGTKDQAAFAALYAP